MTTKKRPVMLLVFPNKELHEAFKLKAKEKDRSMSGIARRLIRLWVEGRIEDK